MANLDERLENSGSKPDLPVGKVRVENLWKVGSHVPNGSAVDSTLASSLREQPSERGPICPEARRPHAPNSGVTDQDWRRAKRAVSTCGALLLWAVTPGCRPC